MIFADLTNFKVNCSESTTTNWMTITLENPGVPFICGIFQVVQIQSHLKMVGHL